MNPTSPVLSTATDATATGECLIGQCNEQERAHPAIRAELFAQLREQLLALPLNQEESCLLLNMTNGSERMAVEGEYMAARWGLKQLVRTLRRFQAAWDGIPVPADRPETAAVYGEETRMADAPPAERGLE